MSVRFGEFEELLLLEPEKAIGAGESDLCWSQCANYVGCLL